MSESRRQSLWSASSGKGLAGDVDAVLAGLTRLRTLEYAIAFVFLLLFSGAVLDLWRDRAMSTPDHIGGDPVRQLVWSIFYLYFSAFVVRSYRQTIDLVRSNLPLVVLLLFAAISTLWAFDTGVSVRRVVALGGTTIAAIYFIQRFSLRELAWLLLAMSGVAAVISAFAGLIQPVIAIDADRDDALRGVFVHRNRLAPIMVLGILIGGLASRQSRKHLYLIAPLIALFAANLIWTGSRTGYAVGLVLAVAVAGVPLIFRHRFRIWSGVLMLAVALAILTTTIGPAVSVVPAQETGSVQQEDTSGAFERATGRSATLTGRVLLWRMLIGDARDRPVLGYGYGGYWAGDTSPGGDIWNRIGRWNPSHAHNGYIDLLLEVGLIGVGLFVTALVLAARSAVYLAKQQATWLNLIPGALLVFLLLYNLTETRLMQHNSIYWMLFAMVAFGGQHWCNRAVESVDSGGRAAVSEPIGQAKSGSSEQVV